MFDVCRKFRFRNFPVYRTILSYNLHLRRMTGNFPEREVSGLASQLHCAADSIALNLTEGSERYSDKNFARFISIALASLNETVACLDLAMTLGYMSSETHLDTVGQAAEIGNQLSAFRETLVKGQKSKVKSAPQAP